MKIRSQALVGSLAAAAAAGCFALGAAAEATWQVLHPAAIELAESQPAETSLVEFTELTGTKLRGNYAGQQPRFVVAGQVVVPAADRTFELDLSKLAN